MSRVVSALTGRTLLCCWTECDRLGDTRYQTIEREPGRNVIRVFCSDRHKLLWVNSVRDMGNLPTGTKGLLPPR